MSLLDKLKKVPAFITATGAGAVIGNSIQGYATGQTSAKDAIFQGGLGLIGLGLRWAIYKNSK